MKDSNDRIFHQPCCCLARFLSEIARKDRGVAEGISGSTKNDMSFTFRNMKHFNPIYIVGNVQKCKKIREKGCHNYYFY